MCLWEREREIGLMIGLIITRRGERHKKDSLTHADSHTGHLHCIEGGTWKLTRVESMWSNNCSVNRGKCISWEEKERSCNEAEKNKANGLKSPSALERTSCHRHSTSRELASQALFHTNIATHFLWTHGNSEEKNHLTSSISMVLEPVKGRRTIRNQLSLSSVGLNVRLVVWKECDFHEQVVHLMM